LLQIDGPSADAVVARLPTAAQPTLSTSKEPQHNIYSMVRLFVSTAATVALNLLIVELHTCTPVRTACADGLVNFYLHDAMLARVIAISMCPCLSVCVCVCLSVTSWCSIKKDTHPFNGPLSRTTLSIKRDE